MADPGFRLYGEAGPFYPAPTAYQARHMALIKHVSDMPFKAWGRAVNEAALAGEDDDPLLLAALVAVAAWQANPDWTREQAYKFGDDLDMNDVAFIGFDAEGDAGPPDGEVPATSSDSASGSSTTPDPPPMP